MNDSQASLAGPNWYQNKHLGAFVAVFLFRYVRVVANQVANTTYRPIPIPSKPSYEPSDVTVVCCTTDIANATFHKVVQSILDHSVHTLIIPIGGAKALTQVGAFTKRFPDARIKILWQEKPSKRQQTALALQMITTRLMVITDDHTYWPSPPEFLASLIAPFEDPKVGGVGPVIDVRHRGHPVSWEGFWNFIGMTYLLRRAFEFVGTNSIDGGISCLSSRWAIFRSEIYCSRDFIEGYLNEELFWGSWKIRLDADDDKYHTRYLATNGWKVQIQGGPESVMTTELGDWPNFWWQCLRWTRTTYRSNPRALFMEATSWYRFPYTTYAILIHSFFRFSLFQEAAMVWFLYKTMETTGTQEWFGFATCLLMLWCTVMKFAKIILQFRKHPKDLVYFPGYVLFGYVSSGIRLWAMFTCWEGQWKIKPTEVPGEAAAAMVENVKRNGMRVRGGFFAYDGAADTTSLMHLNEKTG
jgi:hypothetical protein